ncbi:hypothetical protein LJR219_002989 [Phenylobacterium sp. LjRoot219]|uniref:hypothetical protein n=1 Tax=Phenylobacterium sp. LjRoot219 TaxID=3342283 RepID=UPI003ECF6755
MEATRLSPEIEAFARELCASEGWDPDERIDCAAGEVALAQQCAVTGRWSCARWQAYAPAAEKLAKAPADDWDTF